MPVISDAEFRLFGELLRAHCGLHFGRASRFLLEKRVGRRIARARSRSFTAYHYALRSAAATRRWRPSSTC